MKTLKFHKDLVTLILNGTKTSTWRLGDEKDLSPGDTLALQEDGKQEPFFYAEIESVTAKRFADLTEDDKKGHETFTSDDEMYETYQKYYKSPVGPDTELKIVRFKVK